MERFFLPAAAAPFALLAAAAAAAGDPGACAARLEAVEARLASGLFAAEGEAPADPPGDATGTVGAATGRTLPVADDLAAELSRARALCAQGDGAEADAVLDRVEESLELFEAIPVDRGAAG